MSQLATVLPIDHLVSASGGPTFSTVIFPGSTGLENRNSRWLNGRQVWALTWQGFVSEIQPVLNLFEATKGIWKSFKFTPPGYSEGDFRFDTDTLTITYQVGQPEFIGTITLTVIQVHDE
jgi:hypothetical protein